ncbi:MAG: FAD-binding oxidoreductase [Chloroflexi bacterium]|nr:FAD-binding oxidoreductase [Chloroflexota bacterium]
MTNYDIIIAGGGVMGCATAYYLLQMDGRLRVAIIEKEPTYEHCSTVLSDGNVRVQFNIKENIQISQYTLEILATFDDDMAVGDWRPQVFARHQGNLFLFNEDGRAEAEAGLRQQQSLGCPVELLTQAQIESQFPDYGSIACAGGTLGRLDGSVDPLAVLMGYKNRAVELGAHYLQGEVASLRHADGRITGVTLANGDQLTAPIVLNGAGAWCADLARTAGVELPVIPVRRQVFVVETPLQPEIILPSLFLPSGLYIIHERGGHFMIGKSLPDDPVGYNFEMHRPTFDDILWPELVEQMPVFERLKVVGGWAGLYAVNTLDGNAILGEWPELKGLYLANGFSGHGFQQAPAVGRYLAELMLQRPHALDLAIFSPERILRNEPVFESAQRII